MLAERLPPECWHPAVRAWAVSRLRAARGPWAVALSGGADSLTLLLLLWARRRTRGQRLLALHFNHRLRGRASGADERFCRRVCAALGVKFRVGRWRRRPAKASEDEARTARFAFFHRALRRAGSRALWLGHHQNDIAETMLMRLARGSGTAGLAAPRPVQWVRDGAHLRPLLPLKKEAITAALKSAGIPWREDHTNAGGGFFRNRIRHQVLPAWRRAAGRDALAGAALARELLEEDDAALEAWCDDLRPFGRDGSLDLSRLGGRPRALVRRSVRRWLGRHPQAGELSRPGFEDLLAAVLEGKPTRRSLGREGFAVIRGGSLRFERRRRAPGRAR
jgi:tRNA(Ile)-lysidine synthase